MSTNPFNTRRVHAVQQHGNPGVTWLFSLLLCLGAVGCGTEGDFAGAEELGMQEAAMAGDDVMSLDGLSTNGLSTNGLSTNGLSTNGLSTNGLSTNGLLSTSFRSWFDADPATRAMLMKYVVLCAVPEGQSRSFWSAVTGITYTWPGQLGLAPGWSGGLPATVAEQQVITACLAAHANKFGVNVSISVLGRNALGVAIPFTAAELATYSENEACFFGNAFTNAGIFAANDRKALRPQESTSRACGLSSKHQSTDCEPVVHVGSCKDFCTRDSTNTFYTQCQYNGVTYKPLTTRILPTEIYTCGDGVCQFTESCGTGASYDNCAADCGACAG